LAIPNHKLFAVKTIVIVDDNPGHALLTEEAFKEYFELNKVLHFNSGKKALDYLHRRGDFKNRNPENPSLILLDLNMPHVHGYDVLSSVKMTDDLRTIPVVMLSLSNNKPDIDRCYRLGANAYVLKDFDYHTYKQEIKTLGEFWGFTNIGPSLKLRA
jgi:CheY-like chemotaxis protein